MNMISQNFPSGVYHLVSGGELQSPPPLVDAGMSTSISDHPKWPDRVLKLPGGSVSVVILLFCDSRAIFTEKLRFL